MVTRFRDKWKFERVAAGHCTGVRVFRVQPHLWSEVRPRTGRRGHRAASIAWRQSKARRGPSEWVPGVDEHLSFVIATGHRGVAGANGQRRTCRCRSDLTAFAPMLPRREFLTGAFLALPAFQLPRAEERGCSPTDGVELGPFFRPSAPRRVSLSDPGDIGG